MTEIERLAQKPFPGVEVDMYDLDLRVLGGSIIRFTNWTTETGEKVRWRGNQYEPVAMEASGYGVNGEGKPVRPRIKIGNAYGGTAFQYVEGDLSALMAMYKNFVGATLRRWVTYRQFLDDGENPDPAIHKPIEDFLVGQMLEETPLMLEWELSNDLDQEDLQLPRGIMTQKYCRHTYRVWDAVEGKFIYTEVTCPYRGTKYADENNIATNDPAKDVCSQRIEGCRFRFGTKVALPIWAYPGMVRVTRRS
jgi:lambda family phage minor tail protein L